MSFIVAIDGPAGAGKGTITKLVGEKLGLINIDTGATYRCVTLAAIEKGYTLKEEDKIVKLLDELKIEFKKENNKEQVFLNDVDVTNKIRTQEVNNMVSQISHIPEVRNNMANFQRKIAEGGNYVVDGRDIGSVVFPDSKYKFYMDASLDERARRRYNEELSKGKTLTYEEVRESIRKRDEFDSNRKDSPLVVPDNAYIIDTTSMTIDEVAEKITNVVLNKQSN